MKEESKATKVGRRRNEIELLVKAKEENRVLLMSKSNVIGIGVGYRKKDGKVTDELVMKVYVSRKLSLVRPI
jgi:flagellar basal body-associated protein FliL